jgi:hypothetical protein
MQSLDYAYLYVIIHDRWLWTLKTNVIMLLFDG